MDERRKYRRIHTDKVKIYRVLDDEHEAETESASIGTLAGVDISMAGLQIVVDNKVPEDARLNVVLAILPNKSPIEVTGKVIWINDAEEEGQFKIGIEFIDFTDEVKKRIIEDYVNKGG